MLITFFSKFFSLLKIIIIIIFCFSCNKSVCVCRSMWLGYQFVIYIRKGTKWQAKTLSYFLFGYFLFQPIKKRMLSSRQGQNIFEDQ